MEKDMLILFSLLISRKQKTYQIFLWLVDFFPKCFIRFRYLFF
jgi:hypothetical protein